MWEAFEKRSQSLATDILKMPNLIKNIISFESKTVCKFLSATTTAFH